MSDTSAPSQEEERLHYFLVCGTVVYTKKDIRNKVEQYQHTMNTVSNLGVYAFTATQIARAQQALQVRLMREFEDPKKITVRDVVINSVSYLGHMTKAEFHAKPSEPFIQMDTPEIKQ